MVVTYILQGENEGQSQRRNYRGTRIYRRRQDGEQQGVEEREGRQGRVSRGYLYPCIFPNWVLSNTHNSNIRYM